jgi:uncharacterized membrane protein
MSRSHRFATIVRGVLVFAAIAPFLPALLHAVPGLDALGRVPGSWFAWQCERAASRGFPGVAVCARCLGVYVGLGVGALVGRPRLSLGWLQLWIALAALALLGDVLTEAYALRGPAASLRLFTGALLAYPVALVIGLALSPSPDNQPQVPSA